MSDLDERAERAVMETWVCGIEIDGVRMLCCDERAKGHPQYWPPEDCHCRNAARAVKMLVRKETLEEAAKVAEKLYNRGQIGSDIASAIRELRGRMSEIDIVEKLRAPAYWIRVSAEGHEGVSDAPYCAAAEIDRLRAQDYAIRTEFDQLSFFLSEWRTKATGAETESEKLSAENAQLRAASLTETLRAEVARLAAENEKLRAGLREAFEVYANSEGFIPETAGEGYLQQVIQQMVDCINAALAGSPPPDTVEAANA